MLRKRIRKNKKENPAKRVLGRPLRWNPRRNSAAYGAPLLDLLSSMGGTKTIVGSDPTNLRPSQWARSDPECDEGDCAPRAVVKPDGRVIPLSEVCVLKAIAGHAIILDLRDPSEVSQAKGGHTLSSAIHCPLNVDGKTQTERPTTLEEFVAKLRAAGVPESHDHPIITHCTGGGRAAKGRAFLEQLGCAKIAPSHVSGALSEAGWLPWLPACAGTRLTTAGRRQPCERPSRPLRALTPSVPSRPAANASGQLFWGW